MSSIILSTVHNEIVAANQVFMDTYAAGDVLGLSKLYTEDAKLMPPNSDFAIGRPAIQGVFQFFMSLGIKRIVLETDEVDVCGETAIEVSRFRLLGPEDALIDHGKYIVVWKMVNGHWLLHRDIFNSSTPAR